MQDQLEQIRTEALAEMQEVETLETLEKLRIKYFGRKGLFTDVMKGMGSYRKNTNRLSVNSLTKFGRKLPINLIK